MKNRMGFLVQSVGILILMVVSIIPMFQWCEKKDVIGLVE